MSAEDFKARGNAALQAKRFDEAIEMYSKAIELDESNHVYFSNRSAAYLSKGDGVNALADADRCIEISSSWAKGHGRKGAALHQLKRYHEAIEAYELGLSHAPGDASLNSGLEEVKKVQSQSEGSGGGFFPADVFTRLAAHPRFGPKLADPTFVAKLRALQQNPSLLQMYISDPDIMDVFGVLTGLDFSSSRGRSDEPFEPQSAPKEASFAQSPPAPEETKNAEPEVEIDVDDREAKQRARSAIAAKDRGNELYKSKQFEEALAAYDEAIALDNTNMTFLLNKAAVYMEMNDYAKCIELSREALEVGKANRAGYADIAKAWVRIGKAYAKLEDYDQAVTALGNAQVEQYSKEVERFMKHLELDRKKAAAQAYINPELALQHKERGNEFFRAEEYGKAVEEYEEATKRDPTNPAYRNNLAAALLKVGNFISAKAQCEKALELDPRYVKAWAKKGDCEFFMKEFHKAMESYQRGLNIDPQDALCSNGLQKVVAKINQSSTEEETKERAEHAMADPEIQAILTDPIIRTVLTDFQTNPQEAQKALRDRDVAAKIQKLVASGILQIK